MLATLYLLRYNNYYNRHLKTEETLSDYDDSILYTHANINFNPADGVNTVLIYNQPSDDADYLLVVKDNIIVSKWFIIESERTLNGQYKLTLHRDLLADYKDKILKYQCFVEKGIVKDNDPAIFNDENLTFNQIKQKEVLLKDNSQCQWLVGYYARKDGEGGTTTLKGTGVNPVDQIIDYTVAGIENWEYNIYRTTDFIGVPTRLSYVMFCAGPNNEASGRYKCHVLNQNEMYSSYVKLSSFPAWRFMYEDIAQFSLVAKAFKSHSATLNSQSKTYIPWHSATDVAKFIDIDGSTVKDSVTNKTYEISVVKSDEVTITKSIASAGNLGLTIRGIMVDDCGFTHNSSALKGTESTLTYTGSTYRVKLTEVTNTTLSYYIPTSRYHLVDSPYDAFAIPFSDEFQFTGNGTTITCSKSTAMSVINDIASDKTNVYDVQLLPYCPFSTNAYEEGSYTSNDSTEFSWIADANNNKLGVIFNLSRSDRQFTIPLTIAIDNYKIDNLTKFCRMVSPNYNGQFEFTPAKNDGVDYIQVNMTIKPYNPYIHLAPNFKRLYGSAFGDARGLICGGDFSIATVSDAWKNYEITNKNYQAQFDRQIQNMEVNNSVARQQEIWGAVAGTVQGGMSGYFLGGGVGAALGAGVSAAAGIADINLNEKLRNETLDYTKDLFGMQMGNIKALPNSLTRVSSFNVNNKGWPFVEFYDCSEEEKEALFNKLKYNGMTVNRIGRIEEYIADPYWQWKDADHIIYYTYIKAKLIHCSESLGYTYNNIDGDYHLWESIAEELNKGVFIG